MSKGGRNRNIVKDGKKGGNEPNKPGKNIQKSGKGRGSNPPPRGKRPN